MSDAATITRKTQEVISNIQKVIRGKDECLKLVLVGLLARGHLLLEDVPGVGKTMLARALARSIAGEFKRLQCTPDLLPSDVVGVSIYDQSRGEFHFHAGPIFANVVLADEINRTTPRTQSALLEAMNDFQVSVDGTARPLPHPFMLLATQNPIEYAGTYPLPEAQLDRFLLRLSLGYPDRHAEREVLLGQKISHPLESLGPVVSPGEVQQLQRVVREVAVEDSLSDYILELAKRTRESRHLALGVSPRGCLMLYRACQALAVVEGRQFVLPDDVKWLALPCLAHRLIERGATSGGTRDAVAVLREILEEVPVPL